MHQQSLSRELAIAAVAVRMISSSSTPVRCFPCCAITLKLCDQAIYGALRVDIIASQCAIANCGILRYSRHTSLLSWGHFVESCRVVWSVALESVGRSNPSRNVFRILVCGGANRIHASECLAKAARLEALRLSALRALLTFSERIIISPGRCYESGELNVVVRGRADCVCRKESLAVGSSLWRP